MNVLDVAVLLLDVEARDANVEDDNHDQVLDVYADIVVILLISGNIFEVVHFSMLSTLVQPFLS